VRAMAASGFGTRFIAGGKQEMRSCLFGEKENSLCFKNYQLLR
jgi:hypothetical protein